MSGPRRPAWTAGALHVWRCELAGAELAAAGGLLLSTSERERAARFRFDLHRRRYVARWAFARCLLSRYAGGAPQDLEFSTGPHGKPALAAAGTSDLRFNLSHSDDWALLAVAHGREVGVDIEGIRTDLLEDSLPERFFAAEEVAVLRALPAAEQPRGFFHIWACKEAYIKGRGMGLSLALDSFVVSAHPDRPAALLATRDDPTEAGRWSLCTLDAPLGYAAAVAVAGGINALHCWTYEG